jgi:hypothetical protein
MKKPKKLPWKPRSGQKCCYIGFDGRPYWRWWKCTPEEKRMAAFLGVYRTEEECKAAIEDIKKKLGK